MSALLAISWEPELRGVLTVIIAVVALCGSVYLILGTNLGARLGFLVALTGLAGWMALLGMLWWLFGIGLVGPDPTWTYVEGRTVIQNPESLYIAGVVDRPVGIGDDTDAAEAARIVSDQLREEGWTAVPDSNPSFGQASTAAGMLVQETGAFGAGEFQVTGLYQIGGERFPKINETLDFLAFFHKPRFALAEISTLEPLRDEPGRAPTQALVDQTQPRQYVYMVRDLGARRQPSALMTIGSVLIFGALCWMLHRRDRFVAENRSRELVPAG